MFPPKLHQGDTVRIIAPARSLALPWIGEELKALAVARLEELGLRVTFGKHVNERDAFDSSSIEHRIEDLHEAFADDAVRLVLTSTGGFNSNQLLRSIDYGLVASNPKVLCGFSDITALANALYAKTGLVTYSGPHFFNFGQKKNFDYTLDMFKQCLFTDGLFDVFPSGQFVDDRWATKQDAVEPRDNPGWEVLQEGEAEGTIIGGNLGTFHLLQGTEYLPDPSGDVVLFIEDDYEDHAAAFDRHLQSLLHLPLAARICGVVVGRCEEKSGITPDLLRQIIETKEELHGLPVVTGVDFGHTTPLITFPIGGTVSLHAAKGEAGIRIKRH